MGLCFLKSACAFSCDLGDKSCLPFPFESYGVALCCPFMTFRSGKNEWPG